MNPKIKSLTNEWIQFAEQDLRAANKLLGEINHITCFHCQQAAEKYIKGLLILRQIDFRKSHDLGYLLGLLNIEIVPFYLNQMNFLKLTSDIIKI